MLLPIACWFRHSRQDVAISFLAIALGAVTAPAHPVLAQIAPDGTLSTTVGSSDGLNFVVEEGHRAGNNLFHSFESFSVPTGGSVHFNNAADITRIFSRVTGGQASSIDGLIESNSHADLFLINPSGFQFSEAAELRLGSSFFATTADRFAFNDGTFFSATDLQPSSVLSIHAPIGVQFGNTANLIRNRSQALDLDSEITVGLQVAEGESLTLLAGAIEFDHGVATAYGGQVNLGAVAPRSWVAIDSSSLAWRLGYERAIAFQDIFLAGTNSFNTSGYDTGLFPAFGDPKRVARNC